jgi:hypothetical protein
MQVVRVATRCVNLDGAPVDGMVPALEEMQDAPLCV